MRIVLAVQEAGYSLVTLKPVHLPILGRIDLGAPLHATADSRPHATSREPACMRTLEGRPYLCYAGSSILNAIIRFVNLEAPAGKQASHCK